MRHCLLSTTFVALLASGLFAQNSPPAAGPMKLTLKQAIDTALIPEGNALLQLAAEGVEQAKAHATRLHADQKPDFQGVFSTQTVALNLASLGLPAGITLDGVNLSQISGSYSITQAKVMVNQKFLDMGLSERVKAARTGIGVAQSDEENTKDRVAGEVAKLYLWASRLDAKVSAAHANLGLAETLLKRAQDRQNLGTGLAVDTARAGAQVANVRQEAFVAESEQLRTHLNLLKAMNLELDTETDLVDGLNIRPVQVSSREQAMDDALKHRSDYLAQVRREESSRVTYHAGELERLPYIEGTADYGTAGAGISLAQTYSVGVSLRVPIMDSGRRKSELAEDMAAVRQEEIRTKDLHRQIELEVKLAFGELESGRLQVTAAEEGLTVAQSELAHAMQRYDEGVANSLEISDAQDRLERARDNRTEALFNLNAAQIDLMVATGVVRDRLQ
ncbi:MAG TPA: TolC family protein [Terriglobia bacterium]|jgi:outer membrane protein TolC